MLQVQPPLSAHNPHMNASHFHMIRPPHACPMLLHVRVHFVTKLCHYLANCPRNRATVSRAVEPHARASCATVVHCCALVLVLLNASRARGIARLNASRVRGIARLNASRSLAQVPLIRGPIVPHTRAPIAPHACAPTTPHACALTTPHACAPTTPQACAHALARCSVRHPHMPVRAMSRIACAHATSYTLLPFPSQRVRLALFSCLPQARPCYCEDSAQGPKPSHDSWPS